MEKEANFFFVGIFVSLAALALVGFSIWLMGAGSFERATRYTIYFTDPVSGLVDEAAVKYKGVDVGRIVSLRLAPERTDLVKVDIEVEASTPIRAGTTASIELQGITGQSYLELTTPTMDQEPPRRVAGEEYPVLEGRGSRLRAFLDTLPELTEQLRTTLGTVDELSKEGAMAASSIRGLADNLKGEVGTTLSSISEFSKEGAKTADSLRGFADNVSKRLDTTLSTFDTFSKESAETASALRGLSDNLKQELGTTLSSISEFTKEGSRTAESIRGLADKLEDDPSQIIKGPPSQRGVVIAK